MQYQVLLDPTRIYSYHVSVPQSAGSAGGKQRKMQAADFTRKVRSFSTYAAWVW